MAVALETADPVDVLTAGTDPVTPSDCLAGSPVTSYSQALLLLVELLHFCALLRNKDPAQVTQSPLLGGLELGTKCILP